MKTQAEVVAELRRIAERFKAIQGEYLLLMTSRVEDRAHGREQSAELVRRTRGIVIELLECKRDTLNLSAALVDIQIRDAKLGQFKDVVIPDGL